MNETKIKILCDFIENIAKTDNLELLGICWNPKANNGQMMINFPEADDKRVIFLLSVLIANAIVKSQSTEEKVDGLLKILMESSKYVATRLKYPDSEGKQK